MHYIYHSGSICVCLQTMKELLRKCTMNVQIVTNKGTGRGKFFIKCGLQSWWNKSSCNGLSYGESKHLDTCSLFCLERENWKPNIIQLNQKLRSCIKFKADYGDTEGYVQKTTVSCTSLCWLTSELRGTGASPTAD